MLHLDTTQPAAAAKKPQSKIMELRRYIRSDIPFLVDTLQEYLQGTAYAKVPFSAKRLTTLLESNVRNDLFFTMLAVDEESNIVGGITAYLMKYIFSEESYADEMCFFILPGHRSLKLARQMIESYVEWAKRRKVWEVRMSTTSGVQPEEYGKFLEVMGFKNIGQFYGKEL
jgi:GNAT superfamily N-acetyltransferase